MNLITETIEEIQRQDRVNDIDLSGVVEILHQANDAYNRALTIHNVSDMLCGSFDPDTTTSSATKCKCGREKWEHPKAT